MSTLSAGVSWEKVIVALKTRNMETICLPRTYKAEFQVDRG